MVPMPQGYVSRTTLQRQRCQGTQALPELSERWALQADWKAKVGHTMQQIARANTWHGVAWSTGSGKHTFYAMYSHQSSISMRNVRCLMSTDAQRLSVRMRTVNCVMSLMTTDANRSPVHKIVMLWPEHSNTCSSLYNSQRLAR